MPVERIPAPNAGIYLGTPTDAMPKDGASELINFLPHTPGRITLRGPLGIPATVMSSSVSGPFAGWSFGVSLVVVEANAGAGGRLATYFTNTNTSSERTVASNELLPKGRCAVVGKYAFGPSRGDKLIRWDGGDNALSMTNVGNGPIKTVDACAHLNRVFTAGGIPAGQPNSDPVTGVTLSWSDLGGDTTDLLSAWQDDASGLVNRIEVGEQGDPIVGIQSIGRLLVILKRYSLWVLAGDTPSAFTLRKVASSVGCLQASTIVPLDSAVFFISTDGPVLFDGYEVKRLGAPTQPAWAAALVNNATTFHSAVSLPSNYVLVAGYDDGNQIATTWLVHLPSGAWTRMFSSAWLSTPRLALTNGTGQSYIFDTRSWYSLASVTNLDANESQGQERDLNAAKYGIEGQWRTRTALLALPTAQAQIRRYLLDYRQLYNDAQVGAVSIPSIFIFAYNENYSGLAASPVFPGKPLSSVSGRATQRLSQDLYAEAEGIFLHVFMRPEPNDGSVPYDARASSIISAWIEYDAAQRSRTR